jgi:hypothetical protein
MNSYECMYWPFIVNAVNFPTQRDVELDQFVQTGLQHCVDRIWINETGFQHRHHGTWGLMRACTRSALVLLGAKRCGQLDHLIPVDWELAVRKVVGLLEFWKGECGDAGNRRDILENALNSLV